MTQDLNAGPVGSFFCPGRPRTKGSLQPRPVRNGRGQMKITVHDTPESTTWKLEMIKAIREQNGLNGGRVLDSHPVPHVGPVKVICVFYFERTQSVNGGPVPSHQTPWPTDDKLGDLDKLERNLLDALTQSGLIADDRLVVRITSQKQWTTPGHSGVSCQVWAVE